MFNIARFSLVLVAFVASLTGVVWTTASTERSIGVREADERGAAEAMRDAVLARESALRGYAVSAREGFLQPYDEATAAFAAAADRSRTFAEAGDTEERALIAEQERLSERWVGIANDMIIRVKNGRPVSGEASDVATDVIERFETANDALVEEIAAEGSRSSAAIRQAVLLIVLLSAAFAAAGSLLLVRARRAEARHQLALAGYHASQREFAQTLQVTRERERGARARQAAPRALAARLGDRRPEPQQQPGPTRGGHTARGGEPTRAEARRLLAQLVSRRPARPHHAQSPENEPLLTWPVLAARSQNMRAALVGGEVIGSVLVAHEHELSDVRRNRIDESVSKPPRCSPTCATSRSPRSERPPTC